MKKLKEYKEFVIIVLAIIGAIGWFTPRTLFAEFQQEVRCDRVEDKVDRIQDWLLDLFIKHDGDLTQCSTTEKAAQLGKKMELERLTLKLKGCNK